MQLHVLADERDLDVLAKLAGALDELAPLAELRRRGVERADLASRRLKLLAAFALGSLTVLKDPGVSQVEYLAHNE